MVNKIIKICLSFVLACSLLLQMNTVNAISNDYEESVMPTRQYEHIETSKNNSPRARSSLSSAYSSVDQGYVTSVKNQGSNGNCWAFAACSVAESYLIKHGITDSHVDLSEAHLNYYMYNNKGDTYSNIDNDKTIIGDKYTYLSVGADPRSVQFALSNFGLANESSYPLSQIETMNGSKTDQYNTDYILTDSRLICSINTKQCINAIKQAIYDNGSVFATYLHQDSYYNNTNASYYNPNQINQLNHAITIVGWDDNYSSSNFDHQPSSNGAWLVKNSWGDGFGNNGYFWMSYDESTLGYVYSYEFMKNDHISSYQYDGTENPLYYAGITYTDLANVFEVKKDNEKLKGVSIATFNSGVNYQIEIYTNLQNPQDPTSGTLAIQQSDTIAHVGVNYVNLNNEISLNQGSYYSIVIKPNYGSEFQIMTDRSDNRYSDIQYECDFSNEYCLYKSGNSWIRQNSQEPKYTYRIKGIVNQFTINETILNIEIGQSKQLTVSQTGGDWSSSDPSIASVDANGKVTAHSIGQATITYTLNGEKLECEVYVNLKNSITGIQLNKTILNLNLGDYETLKATIMPTNTTDSKIITWYSENDNIASVSTDGTVTANGNGSTNVIAKTANGKIATCKVNVYSPLKSISLNYTDMTMYNGEQKTLKVTYNPFNTTDNKNITWSSTNSSVAIVDDAGVVTAKNPGSTTIVASCNGKTATCTIAVIAPLSSIYFDKTSISLNQNSSATLNVYYNPSNTTDNKSITWSSSDSSIARVNSNGQVTGINPGTATIYAKCNGKVASCLVSVYGYIQFNGFTWQVYDDRILIGSSYNSNDDRVRFTFKSYNLDTKVWSTLGENKVSNWQTWNPSKGNYWIYCEALLPNGYKISQVMCFAVGKNYSPYVSVDGFTWQVLSDRINIGVAYTSNGSGIKFTFKSYNLDTKVWTTLSTNKSSNWQTWYPSRGNYWIYCEATLPSGYKANNVMCFAVGRNY